MEEAKTTENVTIHPSVLARLDKLTAPLKKAREEAEEVMKELFEIFLTQEFPETGIGAYFEVTEECYNILSRLENGSRDIRDISLRLGRKLYPELRDRPDVALYIHDCCVKYGEVTTYLIVFKMETMRMYEYKKLKLDLQYQ